MNWWYSIFSHKKSGNSILKYKQVHKHILVPKFSWSQDPSGVYNIFNSVASPIWQQGQREGTFPIFPFLSLLFFFWPIFPNFSLIFTLFFFCHGHPSPVPWCWLSATEYFASRARLSHWFHTIIETSLFPPISTWCTWNCPFC